MSDFRWGTITSVTPLRVQLDGDDAALLITPDTLIDPAALAVSDRVRCELSLNRLLIVARAGGLLAYYTKTQLNAGQLDTRYYTETEVNNLLKVVQGRIPSSVVVGSGTASASADGTIPFSGCSSVSLNDIFDGLGGDIYAAFLSIDGSSGAAADVRVRLRNAGADISATNYEDDRWYRYSGGFGNDHLVTQTSVQISSAAVGTSWAGWGHLTISSPAKANVTGIEHRGRSKGVTDGMTIEGGAHYWNTAVATGLTFYCSAGTMSGSVKVVKLS